MGEPCDWNKVRRFLLYPIIYVRDLIIGDSWHGWRRKLSNSVDINYTFTISYLFVRFLVNIVNNSRVISVILKCLDINPGFIDFRKNVSFYWFLQKVRIWGSNFSSYKSIFSTGLGFYLNPFANICARYLLSFDSKATAYLTLNP